jgi:hypothetical protein
MESADDTDGFRGNGNRALWGPITILDGAIYRLPNGELVRASVVPHPEALPEYWEDVPPTHGRSGDSWPRGEGLILSVLWHAEGSARGSIGPALLRFLNAPAVAGVPWGSGYSVSDLDVEPGLLRDTVYDDYDTGWTLEQLTAAGPAAEAEFAAAVRLAREGTQRLALRGIAVRLARDAAGTPSIPASSSLRMPPTN